MTSLDPAQQERLDYLRTLARDHPARFQRHVSAYVQNPQAGDEAVFRHRDLLEHTVSAVDRLLTVEGRAAAAAAKGSGERARRHRRHEALGRESRAGHRLLELQDAESPVRVRRRAERVLGRVLYTEALAEVIHDLERGKGQAAAERKLRERLQERGWIAGK